jgi:hypothetical protein
MRVGFRFGAWITSDGEAVDATCLPKSLTFGIRRLTMTAYT